MTTREGAVAEGAKSVTLGRTAFTRWKAGHPWLFEGSFETGGSVPPAGVVRIIDYRGKFLGMGLFSPASKIALRVVTREERPLDARFFVERLTEARAMRDRIMGGRHARREVFSESDGLPSLIVDRYGEHLVIQLLSAGLDALEGPLIDAIEEVHRPASILARNDVGVRSLEKLTREVRQIRGTTPPVIEVREGDRLLEVDPWKGQKTGLFLDQVENHEAAALLTKGRVLDVFSCTGGFGLAMARHATQVVMVDSSHEALEAARRNAARNDLDNVVYREESAFDWLKQADSAGEKFDMIVLDPPAFAKNRKELEGAVRGYKEINLRAMKMLYPGGIIITCSCSHHMTAELFHDVLAAAAADVKRRFRVIETRTQSRDHPLLVGFPESYYLKCQILQWMD